MSKITLHKDNGNTTTSISNRFIDDYMTSANGEFVKIYLYLLRCMNTPNCSFSISKTADKFDHTEKDVQRALKYWEKMNLLRLEYDEEKNLSNIYFLESNASHTDGDAFRASADTSHTDGDAFRASANTSHTDGDAFRASANTSHADGDAFRASANTSHTDGDAFRASANTSHANGDSAASIHSTAALEETSSHSVTGASNSNAVSTTSVATKPCYTADDMKMFREKNEVQELLFVAESYLGRMLNPTDIQCLLYWYDGLHFSTDLIVYLMEYCIAKGHSSLRYMEKVALNWKDSNIETVEQAKRNVNSHSQIHFAVMKALGISGRNLVPMESAYTDKWTKEFGFGQDIIEEACRRTISVTHQPSFEYTDKILDNWHKQQIHQLSDIVSLDVAYQKSKAENKTVTKTSKAAAPNKFNNFPQRTYDLDQLEAQLLNSPNATQGGSHGTK